MLFRYFVSSKAAALMGLAFLLTHPTAHAQAPAASGTVITIAGTGATPFSGDGGPATNASFAGCYGVALGPDGTLYFTDNHHRRIRAISPATGIITTLAGTGVSGGTGDGGPATNATISSAVVGLAVDRARHALYLADSGNSRVRKVNLADAIISNYAGTGQFGLGGDGGPATAANLFPVSVATDGDGNLYIDDPQDNRVRRVNPVTAIITAFAGNGSWDASGDGGPALAAGFSTPYQVASDAAGNVFVLDLFTNGVVRRIDAATGIINTIAGGGTNLPGTGPATNMNLVSAEAIAVDPAGGKLYIGGGSFDYGNHRVFQVDLATGQLSPFAGTGARGFSGDGGPALAATFNNISALAVAPGGGLIISDNFNGRLRYVVPDSILVAGDSQQTSFHLPWVSSLTGNLIFTNNPNVTNVNVGAVTSVGGSVNVSQNTAATGVDLSSLTSAGGSVSVSGNTTATGVDLGSLTTAGGGVDVSSNTAATGVDLGSLTTAGASVNVSENTAATGVDLGSLTTAGGSVNVSGNTAATGVDIGALVTAGGFVDVSGNTAATGVDIGSLASAGGSVNVSGNTAATGVDIGSLATAGGSVNVSGNTAATGVDLSSLTTAGGSVNVSGNTAATGIDLGSLMMAGGTLTVSSNAPTVTVNLGSLTTVGGGTNAASITLGSGTVVVGSSFTVGTNATLTGSAILDGSVTNAGTISPGSSPGRFDITGNLVLAGSSQLRLELGGYAPGQSDFLNVNGSVALGGTLAVSLINGFQQMMTNGASFTLLTAGSPLAGAFANVASGSPLTTTDGYARFTVRYGGLTSVQLTDFSIIDTDFDGTADVDEALAGTDPNDPASRFRILTLQPESGSVRLTWSTVGGKSYVVQTNGGLTAPFTDLGPPILVPGYGESATNLLIPRTADSFTTYFRVRIVP